MPHDTTLIATVALGLILAAVGGYLARLVRLPPLIGYLIAGVAIGPFTPGFVGDADLAGQLAEIGVILLMFGVGLHFSIKDLLVVHRIVLPGALVQIGVATTIGTAIALNWGWSLSAGVVLGLALSVASTVVLLRALEERNALDSVNGRIAVGWLVVEDLAMVLALVLLPALAGPLGGAPAGPGSDAEVEGGSLVWTLALAVGKLALFIGLTFLVGTRLVPWLLERIVRTGSRELFTLTVLALALGIAFGSAEFFGVSFALGAFFAGVVLSESDFSHQAAADSLPLKDAFAVLFFVAVGMLFDPSILVREPLEVLAVVLVIVFGKSIAAFALVLAFGYPVTTALTVSASLAQIGEFSFILAGLGVAFGLLPEEGRDLILAGALLSITLNPLVFAAVDPVAAWLRARPRLIARLERSGDLATLADADDAVFDKHALIVGYGRVGSVVGTALAARGLPFIVVDDDRRRILRLRRQNIAAVYGDATAKGVLEAAGVERARLLVVATPEGFHTRRVIDLARKANPGIDTAIRTQSAAELAHFDRQGVGLAIMGERELALSLARYALRSLGVSDDEARRTVQSARTAGDGGAFERRRQIDLPRGSPELAPGRTGSDDDPVDG
jgi:CPA2 family monovalent cation:H+ antiporter-2